ncbi:MAG: hypothetical protein JW913_14600 [Chitinispirillaceae bacterium]|nr:hypothetical protein [Chitinispirillaceae bacterium]
MLTEREMIDLISHEIPSGPARLSMPWTHDAEVCAFGAGNLLFTTDEFSAEDHFPASNPRCLGWNIAAGAISDIIATGGTPLYYAHALTVDDAWDGNYLIRFCRGVREVLKRYGVTFIGGDVGRTDRFRCTASVIGKPSQRVLCRTGSAPGDRLYVTGRIGAGNYNAALDLFGGSGRRAAIVAHGAMRFLLLDKCAPVVTRYATACIDTSDGVFLAADTLADVNSSGYRIENLPYSAQGIAAARLLKLPKLLLFLGECGEYELLFSVRPGDEAAMLSEVRKRRCAAYRIGEVVAAQDERTVHDGARRLDLTGLTLRGRDFADTRKYLEALEQWIRTERNGSS